MAKASAAGPQWTVRSRQVSDRRVEASVDGIAVWVECDDVALTDHPEAWGTAFAMPAARSGFGLDFDRPVDARWEASARRNVAQATSW